MEHEQLIRAIPKAQSHNTVISIKKRPINVLRVASKIDFYYTRVLVMLFSVITRAHSANNFKHQDLWINKNKGIFLFWCNSRMSLSETNIFLAFGKWLVLDDQQQFSNFRKKILWLLCDLRWQHKMWYWSSQFLLYLNFLKYIERNHNCILCNHYYYLLRLLIVHFDISNRAINFMTRSFRAHLFAGLTKFKNRMQFDLTCYHLKVFYLPLPGNGEIFWCELSNQTANVTWMCKNNKKKKKN